MTIIEQLAASLNRRDEIPNVELAVRIAGNEDNAAVKELVVLLNHKNKNIQSDSIKVLYEIGERNPQLIAGYLNDFIQLLESRNNRLVWGAMTALDYIASVNPKAVYNELPKIMIASGKGSVIAKDHAVNILIRLCSVRLCAEKSFKILLDQLKTCALNQFPMYAENAAAAAIDKIDKKVFIQTLTKRLPEIERDSGRKRIEKVIKKIHNAIE